MASALRESAAWQALLDRYRQQDEPRVDALFAADPHRLDRLSVTLDDLLVDVSRHALDRESWALLQQLAVERGLAAQIEALFSGDVVNDSEGRPALHTALRQPAEPPLWVDGANLSAAVHEQLARMEAWLSRLHSGALTGFDGRPIRDVVNIGIGGSQAGVAMGCEALSAYATGGVRVHTVAAVDGRELSALWERIEPATTLFVVASKSFTTQETLTNARTAWQWLEAAAGRPVPEQFAGVAVDEAAMAAFGIPAANRFKVWEWVGGRYSLASAMGLPLAAAIGMERFRELLRGMHAMDRHFREAPLARNIPVLLGLVGLWQSSVAGASGHAFLPYHPGLSRLPAYLQQLDMESLGKSVDRDGVPVSSSTGTVFWGEVGSSAQHSFFQWLHQGTGRVVAELVAVVDERDCPAAHRDLTLANVLGQAEALTLGRAPSPEEPAAAHRHYGGNRPVTLVLFRQLDPYSLGRLIAMHEHRVFVQAALWGINPFDQWGVELGKQLAKGLLPLVRDRAAAAATDPATAAALDWMRRLDEGR